jgi:hypothetical protein
MSFPEQGDPSTSARNRPPIRRATRPSGGPRTFPLLAGACLVLGCASASTQATPPAAEAKAAAQLDDAPAWVVRGCRAYWMDPEQRRRTVCGVGSAPPHRNRVAARDTAIARARAELARSLRVTIESVVRLEDAGKGGGALETIVHQLASASLRGVQLEAVWSQQSGETHALVSLDVDRVRESVRSSRALEPVQRQDLAERAAAAFAALDAAFEAEAER